MLPNPGGQLSNSNINQGPKQQRIDIPQDVFDEIQKNAAIKSQRYMGETIIGDLLVKFYQDSIRLYMPISDETQDVPAKLQHDPDNVTQIPEWLVHNNGQYKLLLNLNRVGAKTFAKLVKGFSTTPFNI